MKKELILLGLFVVIILYGCTAPEKEKTKIGVLIPLTGEGATSYGNQVKNAILLAKGEIDTQDSIELIFEDSKCSIKEAIDGAKKLVEIDNVKMIIGDVCWTDAIAKITEPAKVLVMSPGSAQSSVREAGDYVFRLKLDVAVDSKALAKETYKTGTRKASVFCSNDNWGKGICANFEEEFTGSGGQIVGEEFFPQSEKDFRTALLKTKGKKPEMIVIGAYPSQIGLIAKQARELGIDSNFAVYRGGLAEESFQIGGKALNGALFLEEFNINAPKTKEFITKYKQKYSTEPNLFAAMGYDAFKLYFNAIKKCMKNDIECMKNYFYGLKNYAGATSTFSFDEKGDVTKTLVLMKIENGKSVPFEAKK